MKEEKFEEWSKENLIDFMNFFRTNYKKEFDRVSLDFDEWKRGN